jgi:hypothetical protein
MCACAIDAVISQDAHARFDIWRESDKTTPRPIMRPLNIMIIDDPEQQNDRDTGKDDRARIRGSFRELRGMLAHVMRPTGEPHTYTWTNRLTHSIDDVFFGSSANSVGLQVADACNWAMWRRLSLNTEDGFYKDLLIGRVVCAKPEPEWSENRHLFRAHDAPD